MAVISDKTFLRFYSCHNCWLFYFPDV